MSPPPQRLAIAIPPLPRVTRPYFILVSVILAVELFADFLDLIIQAFQSLKIKMNQTMNSGMGSISPINDGLLSVAIIGIHITWCIPFSLMLTHIESTLNWLVHRSKCNFFYIANWVLCVIFLLTATYTWLWVNESKLMTNFCNNILRPMHISVSSDQIKAKIYNDRAKQVFDILVCWVYPLQCILVYIDTIITTFSKGRDRIVYILARLDKNGQISVKLDPVGLIDE